MRFLLLNLIIISSFVSQAQMPNQWSSSEIEHKLKKLGVLGNVLYLAAHPDDENTRFISYAANERLFNTAYLSLTRGDGGQNLIGPEIREELGIIRTQELLAARQTDGGQQFFTRANDFGYSKTPEETLEIWHKNKVLSDVVWVIRNFKPDVIVCRFPNDGRGGHGHHTSSALLAEEAFEMAADSTKFAEQLEFVHTWKTKTLYLNTGRWWNDKISSLDSNVTSIDVGTYNELLGTSYNELSARSRTMHKSQGFGSTGYRGSYEEFFEFIKGDNGDEVMNSGNASNWNRIEGAGHIQSMVTSIQNKYEARSPSGIIKDLVELRKEVEEISNNFWKETKFKEIDELIIQCAGIYIEAKADDFSKSDEDSLKVTFELVQRSSQMEVYLNNISNSKLNFSEGERRKISYNEKEEFTRNFKIQNLPISQPYWLKEKGTLGTYKVDRQDLIGKPENDPTLTFTATFNFNGEDIKYNFPLIFKKNDPVKGEMYQPFIITPKVTVNIDQPIYLFSNLEPKEIYLILKSNTDLQNGEIEIKAPKGWNLSYQKAFDLSKKNEEYKLKVILTPSKKATNGMLEVYINKIKASALNTIEYDHIPTQVWFPESEAKLVFVDIKKKGNKIGYLKGAGDVIPESLRNIGYQVDELLEVDIIPENLKQYDAIMLGIRFLNIEERADFIMPKLLDYCKEGGNLIVQYNTAHRLKTNVLGPYPLKLSRDRVTEEDAVVMFLKPNHAVLNTPNKITSEDFDNWVQERGLYFPSEWDANYEAILSAHDTNEEAKNGALLVAKYGKGYFAYTGISFFRELPAGVPGAYRLLVNLISMGDE